MRSLSWWEKNVIGEDFEKAFEKAGTYSICFKYHGEVYLGGDKSLNKKKFFDLNLFLFQIKYWFNIF